MEKLFRQLVGLFLCHETSVATWCDKEIAVIKIKRVYLGRYPQWAIVVGVRCRTLVLLPGPRRREGMDCSLGSPGLGGAYQGGRPRLPSARRIKAYSHQTIQGLLCHYHDCSYPFWEYTNRGNRIKWLELLQTITTFPRSLLLVWNWEKVLWGLQDRERSETSRDLK